MGFGGKGANQCVMASKLGASAAMIAKVSFHETLGSAGTVVYHRLYRLRNLVGYVVYIIYGYINNSGHCYRLEMTCLVTIL